MDRTTDSLKELIETVRTLRGPGGCNWDRSQTLQSLRPYMLEEAYEVADAVDRNDLNELKKELGDLLLHIIMSAEITAEGGHFDLAQVAELITGKLKSRHPHVFDEACSLTPAEVEKQWEAIKSEEKKGEKKQFFDSIPKNMPSLQKAWRIQQRASEVGFTWPVEQKTDQLIHIDEPITDRSAGELLFNLVNLLREKGIEPERALRIANSDFISNFNRLEELLRVRGCSLNSATETVLQECEAIAFRKN
jgi:tetrapyrrole methylase family protein/MazG family protein